MIEYQTSHKLFWQKRRGRLFWLEVCYSYRVYS